eukprot:270563-Pleurochrysis_carterae.AAC.1
MSISREPLRSAVEFECAEAQGLEYSSSCDEGRWQKRFQWPSSRTSCFVGKLKMGLPEPIERALSDGEPWKE